MSCMTDSVQAVSTFMLRLDTGFKNFNQCLLSLQVAGVVGRAESLSALFFLLAIFSYREAVLSSKGVNLILTA